MSRQAFTSTFHIRYPAHARVVGHRDIVIPQFSRNIRPSTWGGRPQRHSAMLLALPILSTSATARPPPLHNPGRGLAIKTWGTHVDKHLDPRGVKCRLRQEVAVASRVELSRPWPFWQCNSVKIPTELRKSLRVQVISTRSPQPLSIEASDRSLNFKHNQNGIANARLLRKGECSG